MYQYQQFAILLRGGGDIATGIALRLYRSGFRRLIILETAHPMAVRRRVAFSEAVYEGLCTVEGITAALAPRPEEIAPLWDAGCIPVMVDPQGVTIPRLRPEVVIEATLAKRNVGVGITDAPLVIGVGPGFTVGENVHCIVETNRGHNLGRVLYSGSAEPDTGIPSATPRISPLLAFMPTKAANAMTKMGMMILNICCLHSEMPKRITPLRRQASRLFPNAA